MPAAVSNVLYKCLRIFLALFSRVVYGVLYFGREKVAVPKELNPLVTEAATSLAHKIRSRKVKSEEVVKAFIERINQVNPLLNAVVQERFELALEEARNVDKYLSSIDTVDEELTKKKPFLGVPFTIKDFYGVKGLKHTSGTWHRKDIVASEDAECVRLMREAGAIPLGVTNVPELCMWGESYNNIYGRTRNPYDLDRMPGGSSGGEGSIISGCGSPMGIGSDIGGSIRLPSFFNGLFGHKPTSGIVSNEGAEPKLIGSYDQLSVTGPICRTAKDALEMLKVLAAPKAHLLSLDKKVNLRDIKIYYMNSDGGNPLTTPVSREILTKQNQVLGHFRTTFGIEPVKVNIPQMKNGDGIFFSKLGDEKEAYPISYELTNRNGHVNLWIELVKSLFGLSKHTLPILFVGILFNFNHLRNTEKNLKECEQLKKEIETLLKDDGVLIYPTQPTTASYHGESIFKVFDVAYTAIINMIEVPSTNCPLGLSSKGLPLGIQVIGSKYQDHLCLAVAQEIENAFGGWVNPSQ